MDVKGFLSLLDGVKKTGDQWIAKCPSHDDHTPSLSVAKDENTGKILVNCHAGCSHKEILRALRIDETELFEQDDDLKGIKNNYSNNNGGFDAKERIKKPKNNKKQWRDLEINDIKAKQIPKDSEAMEYLKTRGFSEKTINDCDIMINQDANLVFPYYNQNGELTFIKYRKPKKLPDNYSGPKMWREKDTKPIFWRMDKINTDKRLVITEGEMDTCALVESGITNVTSVPSGSSDLTVLETCWDWIDQFSNIVIWPDNDEPGLELLEKLATRLGKWRVSQVESEWQDANAHLYKEGEDSVRSAVNNAESLVGGILKVSEIDPFDLREEERIQSSVEHINELTGGYGLGEVSTWTGKSGHGKSTFVLNEITEAINQDYSVLLYNGEYKDSKVRHWSELIFSGESNIGIDKSRKYNAPYVKNDVREHLRDWYSDKYYLYDTRKGDNIEELLETFKYAVGKFNTKMIVVDNLMKAVFGSRGDGNWDRYQLQSELVGELVEFAKQFDVHVMLIAHPKKVEGEIDDLRSISGHFDIVNRTDLVFAVRKVEGQDIEDDDELTYDDDGTIRILKNRPLGKTGHRIVLRFDETTRRFAERNADRGKGLNRVYRWKDSF